MWHSLTTLISVLSGTERRSLVLLLVVLMLVEAMLEMTGVAVVPLYITLLAYPDKLIDNPLLRDALVAHRLSTVRRCDRIVFLKDGTIDAIRSYQQWQQTRPEFRAMSSL